MDLHRMIAELQAERERIDQAIEALERLTNKNASRRTPAQFESGRKLETESHAAADES
jgi:hypothetical protein